MMKKTTFTKDEFGAFSGSAKLIPTPKRMYELWQEYVTWCAENPFIEYDYRGSEAKQVQIEKQQPPTIVGFEGFLARLDILKGLQNYFANTSNRYSEYADVIQRIRAESKGSVLNGALTNYWNANLAGRYLGIATVTETKVTHELDIGNIEKKLSQKDIKMLTDISNKLNNDGERVIHRRKTNQ